MRQLSPRKGMPSPRLSAAEFRKRFLSQFQDPSFEPLASELDKIAAAAWDAYDGHRKSPHKRKAGSEFADPNYELSVDWLAARAAIADARRDVEILSPPRNRTRSVRRFVRRRGARPEPLGVGIWAAYSSVQGVLFTAAALCHWPCSCYPNYSLGRRRTG
jgi:hypothetical protein